MEVEERHHVLAAHSHIGWGAVIAGALASLAFLTLMTSFATACGIPPYRGGTFGAGGFIWMCFSAIVSFFLGGYISAYLAPRREERAGGVIHGMMAWILGTLLIITLSAGAIGLFHGGMANAFQFGTPMAGEVTHAQLVGAAWGAFCALALGLIFGIIGGAAGYMAPRAVKVV
jgi:hypothetical protein